MAFIPHLFLVSCFTLLLLVHARLNLYRSDYNSLLHILKDLSSNGERHARALLASPCNNARVLCLHTISNNSDMFRVTHIVLKSQQLRGFLSSAIGRLSELKELSLPNNQLVHQIPPQIVDCRNLEILNLRNNRFSGGVPSELSSLIRLRILDLSSNKFSGNLNFLTYFPNLEKLSLADNMFTGKVPASLPSFQNLRFFSVFRNSFLEGPLPADYSSSESAEKNVVPKRYIFAENSEVRNQATAMAPSASSKYSSTDIAQANSHIVAPHKIKINIQIIRGWILGFLVGAVAAAASVVIFSVLFKILLAIIKGGGKHSRPEIFDVRIDRNDRYLAFLQKEDEVALLEVIGRGGSGLVYKAVLDDGRKIAIKKIIQPPIDAAELCEEDSKFLNRKMQQIKSEIQIVGRIRHRNILPLLAHVSGSQGHYLVYEFMENGSLLDMLNEVSQGTRELDWLTRHRILMGVAAGLEYLHMNHSPHIIHRDLKPGNILLDDDMEARITDFGIAKAFSDAHTHCTTSNVAGTVGYIAPEYHQTLKFTDKCDIYSFGVLILVLVMGKLPSDDFFQHTPQMSLVRWMRNAMTSEDPSRAIDPRLMGNGFEERILLVLKIACVCTLDNPKERPNSKRVRCMLSRAAGNAE